MTHPPRERVARLALENGAVFRGSTFGASTGGRCVTAEVVFNTAMTGYQEALTDPSYAGQILTMTASQIGNTGVNAEDMESARVHPRAFVCRELARLHSSYRANATLSEFLSQHGVLGISGVDTRALTRQLREAGVMTGAVTDDNSMSDADLVEQARSAPKMAGQNLVGSVANIEGGRWEENLGEWGRIGNRSNKVPTDAAPRILAIDCGAKNNILRHLHDRGCEVELIAHDASADDLARRLNSGEAAGLFLSNGPGDPAAMEGTVEMLKALVPELEEGVPVFGICLGHQLLAQALGAKTYKLPFGHRGANHPVKNKVTGRVEITSQNHGFAVEADSLDESRVRVTHTHLNDGSVAGLEVLGREVFSVQHHPEASPGPHDAGYLFDRFVSACCSRT